MHRPPPCLITATLIDSRTGYYPGTNVLWVVYLMDALLSSKSPNYAACSSGRRTTGAAGGGGGRGSERTPGGGGGGPRVAQITSSDLRRLRDARRAVNSCESCVEVVTSGLSEWFSALHA